MKKFSEFPQDITGMRFGKLVVIGASNKPFDYPSRKLWHCKCDCGSESFIKRHNLLSGSVVSCGCHRRRKAKDRLTTHGKTNTPEFVCWRRIKQDCLCPTRQNFENYGGRGIKMHPEWINSFEKFLAHVGTKPSKRHSIDRINNDGNYEPGNVRWATPTEQSSNKRNTRFFEHNGSLKTLSQICKETGCDHNLVSDRIRRGWSLDDALAYPANKNFRVLKKKFGSENNTILSYRDQMLSVAQAANKYGFHFSTLSRRLKKGWSVEHALETPVKKRS